MIDVITTRAATRSPSRPSRSSTGAARPASSVADARPSSRPSRATKRRARARLSRASVARDVARRRRRARSDAAPQFRHDDGIDADGRGKGRGRARDESDERAIRAIVSREGLGQAGQEASEGAKLAWTATLIGDARASRRLTPSELRANGKEDGTWIGSSLDADDDRDDDATRSGRLS